MKHALKAGGFCAALLLAAATAASGQEIANPPSAVGAISGIQLEPPAPKLRLKTIALPYEIVVVGARPDPRDEIPLLTRERQRRSARENCALGRQSRGEGDPMRPQLQTPEDACAGR